MGWAILHKIVLNVKTKRTTRTQVICILQYKRNGLLQLKTTFLISKF